MQFEAVELNSTPAASSLKTNNHQFHFWSDDSLMAKLAILCHGPFLKHSWAHRSIGVGDCAAIKDMST
jgi:hypothetical protein